MKNYELWYEQEAPYANEDHILFSRIKNAEEDGWEKWSLPLGNGYMGVSVFGRTDKERLQITENSLCNPYAKDERYPSGNGGLVNFCDLYLDFGHAEVKNYRRSLSLTDAIAYTSYDYKGVTYRREHFASYPDRVFATKLTADREGMLSFTLRVNVPHAPYLFKEGDGMGRTAYVKIDGNRITMSGELSYYAIQYEGQALLLCEDGEVIAHDDSITVKNATSAVMLVAVGTNYQMESRVFTEPDPKKKLAPYPHPHKKVCDILLAAQEYGYEALRVRHTSDYITLIQRATVDFGGVCPSIPTDRLLCSYPSEEGARYLEELYFTYGRYLLIASSRPGTYPAHLQGTWTKYDSSPWSAGYWHNINLQMNYWPCFNTNLHEMFLPYIAYFKAYKELSMENSDRYIQEHFPHKYSGRLQNGISIGTGGWLYTISGIPYQGHSGPGTSAFTAKLFTDYYAFSLDQNHLADAIYTINLEIARFLSKMLQEQEDGTLLVEHSASPEQIHNGEYYQTKGCAFDQQLVYECYRDTVKLADILGEKDAFIEKIRKDMEKLDPVQIGASGQIKEYREENFYGDIGEKDHRHISHLVGLYPGTVINRDHPSWLRAAEYSLNARGDVSTGWSTAHKLNAWARTKNGERAHDLLRCLLSKCTLPNLWNSHPPFQIDGNFGGTAGIAEMLLQSHEGYLHLLPALPKCWSNGSFEGLTARGGFTVSASWQNGKASKVSVYASAGGRLTLLVGEKFYSKEMQPQETTVFEF